MSKVLPPLKWHGGKHYLASRIVALCPPHAHYVEPYFGGGAVLLAKDPEGISEVVNDLDGDLINFWHVLQDDAAFELLQRKLQATPFSEAHWQGARQGNGLACPVDRAVAFFVLCRQSLAGRMDCFAPLSRNRTRRAMNEQVSAWLGAIEGLPEVHARLQRVVIVGPKDAKEVIRQQDGENTCFYLDPPYLQETRTSPSVYQFEMTRDQHAELLDVLMAVKGKVLLSGYDSSLYQQKLATWNRHAFDLPNHAAKSSSKRRVTECLWTNF